MLITPRFYQDNFIQGAYAGWGRGERNQLVVSPTGSGKTYTFCFITKQYIATYRKPVVVMAHRDVLLSQISLSLATIGVNHDLLCNKKAKTFIGNLHTKKLGQSFYQEGSPVIVSSVDTLVRRDVSSWADTVGLWVMDEAHHVLRANKWGRCVEKFPNAWGLGVTATPIRADGKGLGRHASGIFDNMIEGITMAELIDLGNLSDYEVFISPIARDVMHQLASVGLQFGDINQKEAAEVLDKKYIIGDVVAQYKRHAMGQRGITFGQSIEHCEHMAAAYNAAGVPAIALSSKNSDAERWEALDKFERGEIWQLVNCALFDEGFDVPAVSVVSMVCATESFGKFSQQFGRALRPLEGKSHAIILDHVGNVLRHKTPDAPRVWTLDDRQRSNRTRSEVTDTSCLECLKPYDKDLLNCPYCGTPNDLFAAPVDQANTALKVKDEELVPMSREELQALWNEKVAIERDRASVFNAHVAAGKSRELAGIIASKHDSRLKAQEALREEMVRYFTMLEYQGYTVDQARIKFGRNFNIDCFTAQTLGSTEANTLRERIIEYVSSQK